MSDKTLSVRLHGAPVADLEQAQGKMRLTYRPDASRALSLSLPVREAPYDDAACEAYFGGLLPESDEARKLIGQRYGANPRNSFALLRAIGYDCAGAVSLHNPSEPIAPGTSHPLLARPVSDADLAKHIRELPRKPLFMDVEGMRLSLAGAQDKAALCVIDGQPALPHGGTPTTHILKPAVDRYEASVFNEYLCLKLAADVGIDVPEIEVRTAEGIPYLLLKRYDRHITPDGRIDRIHQEDFCQALGVPSTYKYQSEGGPGFEACFDLTRRLEKPAPARLELLKRALFNVLIGNCDAHGKNYSLLHPDAGKPRLAPAYDMVCTRYYHELNEKMAMKVGGKYLAKDLYRRHWERFAEEVGIGFPFLRATLLAMHASIMAAIDRERATCGDAVQLSILAYIERHAAKIIQQFQVQVEEPGRP